MSRPVPFVLGSLGAHLVALAMIGGQLTDDGTEAAVFEVDAVERPRPAHVVEPRRPVPEPAPEVAPEPEPSPRPTRRRRRPVAEAAPAPVRTCEPAAETPAPSPSTATAAPPVAAPSMPGARTGAPAPLRAGPSPSGLARGGSPGGSGPGPGAGRSRRAAPAGPDPCEAVPGRVAHLLQAAPYPSWARRLGLEGRLRLSFRIGRDGSPRGVRVLSSTGHADLDRYAIDAMRGIGGLPSSCGRPVSVSVRFQPRRRR